MRRFAIVLLAACSSEPAPTAAPPPCSDIPIAGACVAVGCIDCKLEAPSCDKGTYALPGETACHSVSTCADVEGSLYVDATAALGGDGSSSKPFRTIAAAVAAAAPDAVIAIRPGNYSEAIRLDKPVTLAGRCAEEVTITGLRPDFAAVDVRARVKLRDLSITGASEGVLVRDGDAELDRVYVHDTGRVGVLVDILNTKSANVTVRDSLIEAVPFAGVAAFGARATVERSVVRDTRIKGGQGGAGVVGQFFKGSAPSVTVRRSLVEKNHEVSVGIAGGALEVVDSIIRDTLGMADGTVGNGVLSARDKTSGTLPTLKISGSLIERARTVSVMIGAGEATIERTVIRDALPEEKTSLYGVGIQIEPAVTFTIRDCTIEQARHNGIGIFAATGTITSTLVRNNASAGIGVVDVEGTPSSVTLERVMVVDSTLAGILIAGSEVTATDCAVRRITPRNGGSGDGIVAVPSLGLAPTITARNVTLEGNTRAGFAIFGGTLHLSSSRLACNGFDLSVETGATLTDGGANTCGCNASSACRAQSNSLSVSPVPSRAGR
jgi:hypothetical protein